MNDTPVLNRDDLLAYLESGCKPTADWRIGTEHEKFGYRLSDLRPLPYDGEHGIRAVLQGLERFGWQPVLEAGNVIALKMENQAITLEPGGQLELSGAPLGTLHQTCHEVNTHLAQVKLVAEELGVGFFGLGFQPKWEFEDIPVMPKGRYQIMREYMPKKGQLGLDMMFRSATVQVNLDFSCEADMVKKLRVGLALQPVATALFANSPFTDGRPNGFLSYRSHIWTDTDPDRTGMLPFAFEDGMGFERYVDYALDVPMYFIYRNGTYHDVSGQSFRDFLAGDLPGLSGERPTMDDWESHLTTLFPEVRVKKYIEMRGADGGPWRRLCALPALWVGLLYEGACLDAAWELVKHWTAEERWALRTAVPKLGLNAPLSERMGGGTVRDLAARVLDIASEGLRARAAVDSFGENEAHFLNAMYTIVETGRTPAEDLLDLYHGRWGGSVDPLFTEFAY